jgi:hypothetical protein
MRKQFLRQSPDLRLTAEPLVSFQWPDTTGKTVHDVLCEQVKIRRGIWRSRGASLPDDYVNSYFGPVEEAGKSYEGAAFSLVTDPGTSLTILKNCYDADGRLVVDYQGRLVDTLTNDGCTRKWAIARDWARQLSQGADRLIAAVGIEVQSIACTALLQQGGDLSVLNFTECAGTDPFETPGGLPFTFAHVYSDGSVGSHLNVDRSSSYWGARLVLVGDSN